MKKILFISHTAKFYGAENSLFDILNHLDKKHFVAYLLCPMEGILPNKARAIGIETFISKYTCWLTEKNRKWKQPLYLLLNLFNIVKLVKILKDNRFDLVYTNTSTIIQGAVSAKLLSIPHIWHIRETLGETYISFLGNRLLLKIFDFFSSIIIINSKSTYRFFKSCSKEKTKIIYNGLDTNRLLATKETSQQISAFKKQFSIKEDDILIGMVGSISDRKGQKELILSMPSILKTTPNARLIIVGEDNLQGNQYAYQVKDLCNILKLNDKVIFTGFQENLVPIYFLLDLLVLLSDDEPFGRVLVEAMLFNIPVISTDVGGVGEIIKNDFNGILIGTRDSSVVANTIKRLLQNKDKIIELRSNGKKTVESHFNIANSIKEIERTIAKAINPPL